MIISNDLLGIISKILESPENSKQFLINAGIVDQDSGNLVQDLLEEIE